MKRLSILAGLAAVAVGTSGLVAAAAGATAATSNGPKTAGATAASNVHPTYTFTTLNSNKDVTFNQLLGINDQQVIAGYFGSGTPPTTHPNKGYTIVPPYAQANYRYENFPNSQQTQVVGINDFGQTVGFYVDAAGNNFGFESFKGMFRSVSNPLTAGTPKVNQLLGINNNQVAVGFYNDANGKSHGYEYDVVHKTFTAITPPGAVSAAATGINDQGTVVGFLVKANGNTAAFYLKNGVYTVFSPYKSTNAMALGINDVEQMVGSYVDAAGKTHGFVHAPTGSPINGGSGSTNVSIDDPNGIGTTVINGINNGGSLVGFYTDTAGNTDGFLAVPTPY